MPDTSNTCTQCKRYLEIVNEWKEMNQWLHEALDARNKTINALRKELELWELRNDELIGKSLRFKLPDSP